MPLDNRAHKILMDAYWSSSGWKRERDVSPADFEYAKSKGLMFEPILISHDESIILASKAVASTDKDAVTRAFVASLSTRRLDLRSALGSYAIGRHMLAHTKNEFISTYHCEYCGEHAKAADPNILNFERIKWGGVRHFNPRYIALDLQVFALQDDSSPNDADYLILRSIFESARNLGPSGRLSDLDRALQGTFSSNSSERRTLIAILGYAGILVDPNRPDFRRRFVPMADRSQTPWHKDDWPYPVRWWNGSFGVNDAAIEEWFPQISSR